MKYILGGMIAIFVGNIGMAQKNEEKELGAETKYPIDIFNNYELNEQLYQDPLGRVQPVEKVHFKLKPKNRINSGFINAIKNKIKGNRKNKDERKMK